MAKKHGFFEELKRRHVFRVAIAYAALGWVLIQVADTVVPALQLPASLTTAIVLLVSLAFPIALLLAWAFEMTPDGVRRTEPAHSPVARETHHGHLVGRKLNFIIMGLLAIAVLVLLGNQFLWRVGSAPDAAHSGSDEPPRSIAVLPFENLSSDEDNAYFVAGMQDLILTRLADIEGLKVISRTSTMQYDSHPGSLKQIGEELGVAAILEGSVQKSGKEVLINVQLIDARTDHHLWAESYQRTLDHVFGVEGEVAGQIAGALQAELSPAQAARLATAPTRDQAAMDLFLRAEYLADRGRVNYDTAKMKDAISLYRQAIDRDPGFALAFARLSRVESSLAWFGGGGENVWQLNRQARSDADQAVKLAPRLAAAQLALGYTEYWASGDYAAALRSFSAALELQPNYADALAAQGFVLRRMGNIEDAIASLHRAFVFDPRNSSLAFELGATCMMVSRYPEAKDWLQRAQALDPQNVNAKFMYSQAVLFDTGDVAAALVAARGDTPDLKLARVVLLKLQRNYQAALSLLDGIPDTPDNFPVNNGASKLLHQANLHALLGEMTEARALYLQDLPQWHAQLELQQDLVPVWQSIAENEIGLGRVEQALEAIARAQAITDKGTDQMYGPADTLSSAELYAKAQRPDLAVPLLARALASTGIGANYSPVLLWLDPAWDPIRDDPGFQALLRKYAEHKPASLPRSLGGAEPDPVDD